jgi:hypothetical protein
MGVVMGNPLLMRSGIRIIRADDQDDEKRSFTQNADASKTKKAARDTGGFQELGNNPIGKTL